MNYLKLKIRYWKKRCRLAENVIKLMPSNMQVNAELNKAYLKWIDIITKKQTSKVRLDK